MANLIKNGGDLLTTTDWTGATNGCAAGWINNNNVNETSIVQNNGFVGNAQRNQSASDGVITYIHSYFTEPIETGDYVYCSFKYRSNKPIQFIMGPFSSGLNITVPANTGDAINGSFSEYYTVSNDKTFLDVRMRDAYIGDWYEIDEIIVEKSSVNIVTQDPILDIGETTAQGGGDIINGGTLSFTAGNCWSTSLNPDIYDDKTVDAIEDGLFSSYLTGLTANTTYYVRAYLTNSIRTYYGENVSFTTSSSSIPLVKVSAITDITTTTATGGGDVTDTGGEPVTVRGICWSSATSTPTTTNTHTSNGSGLGVFTSYLTGLTQNTTYFVRAYATNSNGTGYSTVSKVFTTKSSAEPVIPKIILTEIYAITASSAIGSADVTYSGGATVTARGLCWNTSSLPTVANAHTLNGSGTGEFTGSLTGLTDDTLYYVRAYAINSQGIAYSNQLTFTTLTPATTVPIQIYSGGSWHYGKGLQIYSGGLWHRPKAAWAYLLGEWRQIL